MKYILIALTMLTLSACGSGVRNTGEFEPYVVQFEHSSGEVYGHPLNITNIEVKYDGTLPSEYPHYILAQCNLGVFHPTIVVNPNFWPNASEQDRFIVMHHELGHCVLNRGHDDTDWGLGVKGRRFNTMMHPTPLVIEYDFEQYKQDYLNELFGKEGDSK